MKNYRSILEELAANTFTRIQEAESKYRDAEKRKSEGSANPLEAARADLDYRETAETLRKLRLNLPGEVEQKLAELREQLAAELEAKYSADPAKLDGATLKLLEAGILKPHEYRGLMEKALKSSNTTMARMIAKFASDEAAIIAEKFGDGDAQARELRAVGYMYSDPALTRLEAFDAVSDVLTRSVSNPALIRHWEGLSEPLLELL